jgi:hypothetical protein
MNDMQCRSAARARVIAGRETSLSGQPGAESFRTVCGVIVASRIYCGHLQRRPSRLHAMLHQTLHALEV